MATLGAGTAAVVETPAVGREVKALWTGVVLMAAVKRAAAARAVGVRRAGRMVGSAG